MISSRLRIGVVLAIISLIIIVAIVIVNELLITAASLGGGTSTLVSVGLLFTGLIVAVGIGLILFSALVRFKR